VKSHWIVTREAKVEAAELECKRAGAAVARAEADRVEAKEIWLQTMKSAAGATPESNDGGASEWLLVARARVRSEARSLALAEAHLDATRDVVPAQQDIDDDLATSKKRELSSTSDRLWRERDEAVLWVPTNEKPGEDAEKERIMMTARGCRGRRKAGRMLAADSEGFGSVYEGPFRLKVEEWGPAPALREGTMAQCCEVHNFPLPVWQDEEWAFIAPQEYATVQARVQARVALTERKTAALKAGDTRDLFAPGRFVARTVEGGLIVHDASRMPIAGEILPCGRQVRCLLSYEIYVSLAEFRRAYHLPPMGKYPTFLYGSGHPLGGEMVEEAHLDRRKNKYAQFAVCPSKNGVITAVSREEKLDASQDDPVTGDHSQAFDPSELFSQKAMDNWATWAAFRGVEPATTMGQLTNANGIYYCWKEGFAQIVPRSDPRLGLTEEQMMCPLAVFEAYVLIAMGLPDQITWGPVERSSDGMLMRTSVQVSLVGRGITATAFSYQGTAMASERSARAACALWAGPALRYFLRFDLTDVTCAQCHSVITRQECVRLPSLRGDGLRNSFCTVDVANLCLQRLSLKPLRRMQGEQVGLLVGVLVCCRTCDATVALVSGDTKDPHAAALDDETEISNYLVGREASLMAQSLTGTPAEPGVTGAVDTHRLRQMKWRKLFAALLANKRSLPSRFEGERARARATLPWVAPSWVPPVDDRWIGSARDLRVPVPLRAATEKGLNWGIVPIDSELVGELNAATPTQMFRPIVLRLMSSYDEVALASGASMCTMGDEPAKVHVVRTDELPADSHRWEGPDKPLPIWQITMLGLYVMRVLVSGAGITTLILASQDGARYKPLTFAVILTVVLSGADSVKSALTLMRDMTTPAGETSTKECGGLALQLSPKWAAELETFAQVLVQLRRGQRAVVSEAPANSDGLPRDDEMVALISQEMVASARVLIGQAKSLAVLEARLGNFQINGPMGQDSILLLCYGCMDEVRLRVRLGRDSEVVMVAALAEGYERIYGGVSVNWQGATASIVRKAGAAVGGAVAVVRVRELRRLFPAEGVNRSAPFSDRGKYRLAYVKVRLATGSVAWALTFVMSNPAWVTEPSWDYLQAVVKLLDAYHRPRQQCRGYTRLNVFDSEGFRRGVFTNSPHQMDFDANKDFPLKGLPTSRRRKVAVQRLFPPISVGHARRLQQVFKRDVPCCNVSPCSCSGVALHKRVMVQALGEGFDDTVPYNGNLYSGFPKTSWSQPPLFLYSLDVAGLIFRLLRKPLSPQERQGLLEVRSMDGRFSDAVWDISDRALLDVCYALAYEHRYALHHARSVEDVDGFFLRRRVVDGLTPIVSFTIPSPLPPWIEVMNESNRPLSPEQCKWVTELRNRDPRFKRDSTMPDAAMREYLYMRQVEAMAWAQRSAVAAARMAGATANTALEAAFQARHMRIAHGKRFAS
jgi:hypothetical protein